MIEVINLSKTFQNGLSVFKGISFNVLPGEVVSILGPSGAGKSTLLRCVIGLDKEFSGKINIDKVEGREYLKSTRIAFVPQKYSNFKWMTVNDNIEIALHNKTNISELEKKGILTSILEEVDLLGFENYYMNQLSGGMQQRVAVARALVQDTDIIALDEPFAALDMKIRENLQVLIKKINMRHKKTVLFITHDIEEAIFISDKIVVLSRLPITDLIVYNAGKLRFKNELNPAVKYKKEFIDIRQEIESHIVNA